MDEENVAKIQAKAEQFATDMNQMRDAYLEAVEKDHGKGGREVVDLIIATNLMLESSVLLMVEGEANPRAVKLMSAILAGYSSHAVSRVARAYDLPKEDSFRLQLIGLADRFRDNLEALKKSIFGDLADKVDFGYQPVPRGEAGAEALSISGNNTKH